MEERNLLVNGRFWHNLSGWTVSGAEYSASSGDDHYGVAVLSTGGDFVEQSFAVEWARAYTLHLSVYAASGTLSGSQATARIVDGSGNVVVTHNLSGPAATWTENEIVVGLVPGGHYTLRITNNSAAGDLRIDDVWLWWLPATRAQLAAAVHRKLARLASDRGLSAAGSGAQTEGDYTDAVDAALRAVGALNPETDLPDIRELDGSLLATALDRIELEMLERLERDYLVEVDLATGERRESLSQIARGISRLTGSGGAGGSAGAKVVSRTLRHRADDYELGK